MRVEIWVYTDVCMEKIYFLKSAIHVTMRIDEGQRL